MVGSGAQGFFGDGGPATAASLHSPTGVALDSSGNLYIADGDNNRIRKVSAATGVITTIAGSGDGGPLGGFSGDDGPATAAALSRPEDLAVDSAGNAYIADSNNHRIRKVTAATGFITTVAGSGARGFSGDEGSATMASLFSPGDVALDDVGNLYIADTQNNRIRKVTVATGVIATLAGNGAATFLSDGGPATQALLGGIQGIELDGSANLYIADSDNNRIRKVAAATGVITTVAGGGEALGDGGLATEASLFFPSDVAIDGSGNLYIADDSNRIRKVTAATGVITTVAGNGTSGFSGDEGPATAASVSFPEGVALDRAGNLFIADTGNHRIRKVTVATGIITTVAGNGTRGFSGDGGPATAASLSPSGLALDSSGNLYIADGDNNRVRKVDAATGTIATVVGSGAQGFSGDGSPATAASLDFPMDVAVDNSGNLYIADFDNHRIRKISSETGFITTVVGSGLAGPFQGRFSGDGGSATAASLSGSHGVALDGLANLYIADWYNKRVRAVYACVNVDSPLLASPSSGSVGISTSPRLGWSVVRGAFRYDVLLDTVSLPKQVIASDIATTTFSPANLEPLTTYYWQVVAKGDPFCVPFSTNVSEVRSFTTAGVCTAPGSFGAADPR